jgi:alanyl-tRNA synthetase
LEEVGRDTSHLTLFEMLGNWSFGDYWKEESISWAWELLVSVWGLDPSRLYASVFDDDDESYDLWLRLTDLPSERVLRFGHKDNFWEMGTTGPCGPCSEIHYDFGPDACSLSGKDHECGVNGECGRYLELWNLVFIQFNREESGELTPLPDKHVDTGMGFERIVATLNGKWSAYETDVFQSLIGKVETISGVAYSDGDAGMPHRVLADHTRMVCVALMDNVRPSNEGRGYVVRRLLRRALKYAKSLGVHHPIMVGLVDNVVDLMGGYYPGLVARKDYIKEVIQAEETQFLRTLDEGLGIFEKMVKGIKKGGVLSGDEAFQLYDTFGFPIDLTELVAEEKGISVDMDGFNLALTQQKERSRSRSKSFFSGSKETEDNDLDRLLDRSFC